MLWTSNVTGGPRRVNHAAVSLQQQKLVFTFGGYCTGDEYNQIEKIDVHIFNLSNLHWYKLKLPSRLSSEYNCVPFMRYGHTASCIGPKAYIFGGRSDRYGACNFLYSFDTIDLRWSIPNTNGIPPEARDGHSACVIETKLYIFGGFTEIDQQFSSNLYFLDSETMTWHYPIQNSLNIWRDFHTSTSIGNSIYVFGGRGDFNGQIHTNHEIYDNKIYEFDTAKMKWSELKVTGRSPIGRRSHSAVEYNGILYIFGGYNGRLKKHFADMWKFDPVKKTWTEINQHGNPPCARRRHSWCLLGHEAVLFGGTCPTQPQDDVPMQDEDEIRNLKDLSDVYIFDFCPTLATLCKRAVLSYNVDCSELPYQIRSELESMKQQNFHHRCSSGMTQG